MPDPIVDKYKIEGDFYLWFYSPENRNNAGVHFTCNDIGAKSFLQLIALIKKAKWPCKKLGRKGDVLIFPPKNGH